MATTVLFSHLDQAKSEEVFMSLLDVLFLTQSRYEVSQIAWLDISSPFQHESEPCHIEVNRTTRKFPEAFWLIRYIGLPV